MYLRAHSNSPSIVKKLDVSASVDRSIFMGLGFAFEIRSLLAQFPQVAQLGLGLKKISGCFEKLFCQLK